jgi:hypothetical protein
MRIVKEAEYDVGDVVILERYFADKYMNGEVEVVITKKFYNGTYWNYSVAKSSWVICETYILGRKLLEVVEMKVVLTKKFGDPLVGIWCNEKTGEKMTPAKLESLDVCGCVVWMTDDVHRCLVPKDWEYSEETDTNQLIVPGSNGSLSVGDSVTIRGNLSNRDNFHGVSVVDQMLEYVNQSARVTRFTNEERGGIKFQVIHLDIDNGDWNWTREMFVEVH